MVTAPPILPFIHCISASSNTSARFVFKLYVFFDQFSTLMYFIFAPFFTKSSTQPACKDERVYDGAEHPSMYDTSEPSSAIMSVCSNCADASLFIRKYACSGSSTFTPFGT